MPAVTKILDEIEARLQNILETNGYHTSVKAVKRARLKPFSSYDLPAANVWAAGVTSRQISYRVDERAVSLFVEYHGKTRDLPFTTAAEQMAADVVTALNRSTDKPRQSDADSRNLGGLVLQMIFNEYNYEIGEGQAPYCGILAGFTAIYRCASGDMENLNLEG